MFNILTLSFFPPAITRDASDNTSLVFNQFQVKLPGDWALATKTRSSRSVNQFKVPWRVEGIPDAQKNIVIGEEQVCEEYISILS